MDKNENQYKVDDALTALQLKYIQFIFKTGRESLVGKRVIRDGIE